MSKIEVVRATSPVGVELLESLNHVARQAYAEMVRLGISDPHKSDHSREINRHIATGLMGFEETATHTVRVADYGIPPRSMVSEYEIGLIGQKGTDLVFDGAWQSLLPAPSLLRGLRKKDRHLPQLLVGTPTSVSQAAKEYGVRADLARLWQDGQLPPRQALTRG